MKVKECTRRGFVKQSGVALGGLGLAAGVVQAQNRSANNGQEGTKFGYDLQALVGQPITEIPTPAYLVDMDALERNIKTMQDHCRSRGINLRPHGKHFKSPALAHKLVAAGAIGVCGAKLGEGEVFVKSGVRDVLISAPVIGARKIRMLLDLRGITPEVKTVIDDPQNAKDLGAAAAAAGVRLKVLLDISVAPEGRGRTGVETPEEAVALAKVIGGEKGLELVGVQAYGGHNQSVHGWESRKAAATAANTQGARSWEAVRKAGFPLTIVSVGGTGTAMFDSGFKGVTEVQPGSYLFFDASYASIGGENSETYDTFAFAGSVLTTVISRPQGRPDRVVVDGGTKAMSVDSGNPRFKDLRGADVQMGSDEYATIALRKPSRELKLGDKIEFIPSHSDTNVNLYDNLFCIRNGKVEAVWPVLARGRAD
jgi:D-serine deaminase-like pyridoxal phosphate-dependent protein